MDKHKLQPIFLLKHRKLFLSIAIIFAFYLIYCNTKLFPLEKYWITARNLPLAKRYSTHHSMKNKVILYWNTFFGRPDMYLGTGNNIFQNCAVKTCYATTNKTFIPIEQYDAIIFHGPRYSVFYDGYPEKRSIHQKYIFYSLESPYNVFFEQSTNYNFYNLTMTYRKDSDIHKPYSLYVHSDANYKLPNIDEIKNKTKKIAWFVSNCHTEGSKRRMKYAQELNKYIPVDVYGACGNLTCENKTYCYEMLEKNYKFYLSFENSMCKDYVTEKLFNILKYNVIPIVLGLFSYNNIAPPNSIINTIDFKHPKDLSQYLWKLDKDPYEYLKYFKWKKHYVIKDSKEYSLCQMCKLLNEPIKYSSYENIKDWFYGFNCAL